MTHRLGQSGPRDDEGSAWATRLANLLETNDWTNSKAAEELSITRAAVTAILSGKITRPHPTTRKAIELAEKDAGLLGDEAAVRFHFHFRVKREDYYFEYWECTVSIAWNKVVVDSTTAVGRDPDLACWSAMRELRRKLHGPGK